MKTDDAPILTLQAVSKSFPTARGAVVVLTEVNVSVYPGDFVVITGASGSGKTTFLNLASLLARPTSGRILFRGEDVSELDESRLRDIRKRTIGMVFQSFHLLRRRTVLENVLFRFRYLDVTRPDARAMASAALARVGLERHTEQAVRLLSGGEMQRVAIARAVALPPALLLVDEPTGNLDGASAEAVMEHFRALNRQGITLLMVTHNPGLLAYGNRHLHCMNATITEDRAPAARG